MITSEQVNAWQAECDHLRELLRQANERVERAEKGQRNWREECYLVGDQLRMRTGDLERATAAHALMAEQFRIMQQEKDHGWREAERFEQQALSLADALALATERAEQNASWWEAAAVRCEARNTRMRGQLDKIRTRHHPVTGVDGATCCADCDRDWPCPDARDAAPGGEVVEEGTL